MSKKPLKVILKYEPTKGFQDEWVNFVEEVLNYEENNEETKTAEN